MNTRSYFLVGLLVVSLSLTACSSGSSPSGTSDELKALEQTIQTDEYQVTIPKAWETINKNEFTSDIPKNALAVFQANRKNELFIANVNITKNMLNDPITSLDYGKIVLENQKSALQNFSEKNRQEFETMINGVKQTVIFAKFEGKRTIADPAITFTQEYYVNGKSAYIITGAFVSNEDPTVQKETENIVRSFSIK